MFTRRIEHICKPLNENDCLNWYFSLHDRRFMSQAGRTRYFARSCLALRARVALRAKYRVRPAWLIKRLSCRLLVFWHLRLAPSTCISFYLKTNNYFSGSAYHPHVYPMKTITENASFQKRSPEWRFLN